MKVLVLGTGKMGRGVAWDLARNPAVETVGMVDIRRSALERARNKLQHVFEKNGQAAENAKLVFHPLDITDFDKSVPLFKEYDVGVITVCNRHCSYKTIEAAILAGLDVVDILEEYHRRPDMHEIEGLEAPEGMSLREYGDWLHERAIEAGVLVLDGMGFAPGLSNVTLGEGLRKMDETESAVARVGGIPCKVSAQRHPLRYVITWAFSHVLREYMVKVKIRRDGEIVEVDAVTDLERFHFQQFGRDEELVCAITPGMPSFIYSRPELQSFAEKTIRWPGHWEGILTLKECGLLDLDPVEFEGAMISPREFFNALVEPKLQPGAGDRDVCVMWNSAVGSQNGRPMRVDYYMWEESDAANSAMARVTAFPAAIAAVMIGQGKIAQKGIVPPEDAIGGDDGDLYTEFLGELEKRDIHILEMVSGS